MDRVIVLYSSEEEDSSQSDTALVQASQDDPTAFGLLYERYADRVYAYLRARALSNEAAEDLTQQVFLQALKALPRYRFRGAPFSSWLFRIARNAVINANRNRGRSIGWDHVPERVRPIIDQTPESFLVRREMEQQMQTLLGEVDEATRDLLLLRFAAKLTSAEIGAMTGKSEAATKKALQRALRKLREHYHEHRG